MNESELIDELAELCEIWRALRDKGLTLHTVEAAIKLKAVELTEPAKKNRFTVPTEAEMDAYAKENNINIDGCYDHYVTVGWKVGKAGHKMKNWKTAANGWSKRNFNKTENKQYTADGIVSMARTVNTPLGALAYIFIGSWDLDRLNDYKIRQRGNEFLAKLDLMLDKCKKKDFTQHELSVMAKYGVQV